MALVDAMTHPQHTPAASKTCLASHVSFFFVPELSKQEYFQLRVRSILTTTKLEKPVADDKKDFSASGSNLAREGAGAGRRQ